MATEERKAIPDFFIIKREILWSFFACTNLLGIIYKARRRNKINKSVELRFESEIVTLFYKIKSMIKEEKKFKPLLKIHEIVKDGEKMGFKASIAYFDLMIELLEKRKVLDILKDFRDLGI